MDGLINELIQPRPRNSSGPVIRNTRHRIATRTMKAIVFAFLTLWKPKK